MEETSGFVLGLCCFLLTKPVHCLAHLLTNYTLSGFSFSHVLFLSAVCINLTDVAEQSGSCNLLSLQRLQSKMGIKSLPRLS